MSDCEPPGTHGGVFGTSCYASLAHEDPTGQPAPHAPELASSSGWVVGAGWRGVRVSRPRVPVHGLTGGSAMTLTLLHTKILHVNSYMSSAESLEATASPSHHGRSAGRLVAPCGPPFGDSNICPTSMRHGAT
ncbi:hypothetical protein E2C01_034307 [Portunus trituberculatus]|uniref:Uncharacterized protein n=1 Tax=Portunus trituberculatus TaxID=210409 RepID=A0A5B7F1A4_PORTR|nr:hypothetical protein [Portunus trituberculatus]